GRLSCALPQAGDLATLPCFRDGGGNLIGSLAYRIVGEMRVPLRRARLRVAQEAADDRQAEPTPCPHGGKGVPEVIDADAAQPRVLADRTPAGAQVWQRLAGYLPGKHVIGRRSAIAAANADLVYELQRRRGGGEAMFPPLLGRGRRL